MNTSLVDKKNYAYCVQTIAKKKIAEGFFLELGERLYEIRTKEMYRPSWDSFGEYVAEMDWSEPTASKLITVWVRMVKEWCIEKDTLINIGSWNTLYEVASQSKNKDDAEKLLSKIEGKLPSHRHIILRSGRNGINPDTCSHPNQYVLTICPDCGLRSRVYEQE